uniref:Mannose-P-dolichol utilization defect 1a n=1 Tax=Xiphophorus couchianus TaxID=32473 RepID=A0A3B5L979_9TELE
WPTMDTSPLKSLLVGRLMPEKCYEELFVRLHLHGEGPAQFPQLLKLLWRGSAEGLSLTAFLLQLYALSCPVVYAASNNFPFFAWAERLFTLAQTATIIFLILHYRGETLKAFILSKVAIYQSLLSADVWTLLCGQMCVLITFPRLFKQ